MANIESLILVQDASPDTILQLHDQLSNELTTIRGRWRFTFKIFRNNMFSIPPEKVNTQTTANEVKFLYTLSPSYLEDNCISLINKLTSCVFSTGIKGEKMERLGNKDDDDIDLSIPDAYLEQGVTTGLNTPFDYFVNQRLQSLWLQKQNIKGDGGQIYALENGRIIIRTSNVFMHGNFKGLLIQIEVQDSKVHQGKESINALFEKIISKYKIPRGSMSCTVLDLNSLDKYGDLCLQYSEILNF